MVPMNLQMVAVVRDILSDAVLRMDVAERRRKGFGWRVEMGNLKLRLSSGYGSAAGICKRRLGDPSFASAQRQHNVMISKKASTIGKSSLD